MSIPSVGTRWRHKENGKVYVVLRYEPQRFIVWVDSDTWEPAVLYTDGGQMEFVRPASSFLNRFEEAE